MGFKTSQWVTIRLSVKDNVAKSLMAYKTVENKTYNQLIKDILIELLKTKEQNVEINLNGGRVNILDLLLED